MMIETRQGLFNLKRRAYFFSMVTELFLALFAVDFMQIGKYMLLVLLSVVLIASRKLYINFDFWLLVAFSVMHCLFSGLMGSSFSTVAFFCPVAYLVGLNIMPKASADQVFRIIACLAIFMAFHGFLNFLYEIRSFGQLPQGNVYHDFWSGEKSAVTGQMANYALLVGLFGYLLLGHRRNWLLCALLAASMLQAVIYGSRTHLALCVVSAAVAIVACFLIGSKKKWLSLIRVLLLVVGFAAIGAVAYSNNLFGVRHVIQSSYLYHRLFSDYALSAGVKFFDTDRWVLKLQYLQLMPEFALGGNHIRAEVGYYAHDFWLDIYDQGGVVPFILICFYTLKMTIRFFRMAAGTCLEWQYRVMYLGIWVVVLAQFFVEPALQASPVLVCSIMLIDGVISNSEILVSSFRRDRKDGDLVAASVYY